jgi:hypothetical protein
MKTEIDKLAAEEEQAEWNEIMKKRPRSKQNVFEFRMNFLKKRRMGTGTSSG